MKDEIILDNLIEDNTNTYLLKKLHIAREHFWNFIFYLKDDFNEFEVNILNTVCDECGNILKANDVFCKTCKKSSIDIEKSHEKDGPGKGRKQCSCGVYVAARTLLCKSCGYNFKTKTYETINKSPQSYSKNKKRKKCISTKISNICDVSILIENDKTLNNVVLFKNSLHKFDESSKTAFKCIIDSKNELVKNNLNLVRSIVNKIYFSKRKKLKHLQIEDLLQEGNKGLLKAIDKFDITRRYGPENDEKEISFSTYATFWINREVLKSIIVQDKYIRLPDHIVNKYKNFQNFYFDYIEHNNEIPNIHILMENLKLSKKNVDALLFSVNSRLDYFDFTVEWSNGEASDKQNNTGFSTNTAVSHLYKSGIYHQDNHEIDFVLNLINTIRFKNEDYKNAFLDMYNFNSKEYTLDELSAKYDISKVTLIKIRDETLDKLRKKMEDTDDL